FRGMVEHRFISPAGPWGRFLERARSAHFGSGGTIISTYQRRWRFRIFGVTWITYAGFYLCRKNIGVVLPLLEHDLGYSNTQLAHVIFGYSLFYTLGQLCCGVLSDRFGPRRIVSIGLFLVVISNLVTGFVTSLMMLGLLACLNGLGQSR